VSRTTLAQRIDGARASGCGVLIGYLPLGFPTLELSIEAARVLIEEGFDAVELGIPYSDPVMDGPVIARATQTALEAGFRLRDTFGAVEKIAEGNDTPLVVMTYWNPVLQFGPDAFTKQLLDAGATGLITPDLIPDEAGEWLEASSQHGAERVFLAAPSSSDERLRAAAEASEGFVYAVSTMGITGAREDVDEAAKTLVERLRNQGAERICVGLGISTPEQVSDVLSYADGAIVGSALVKALDNGGVEELRRLAHELAHRP
jgi:tryptophan synthase alpha chain